MAMPCWLWLFRGGKQDRDGEYDETETENIYAAVGALLMDEVRRRGL